MLNLAELIDTYGYLAVFVGAFLEGESILALAGLAAYREYLDFRVVVIVACIAGFLGDQLYFFLGRYRGQAILRRYPHFQERAHRFDAMLARWHAPLIIAIRFMYGFRIVGPVMLGMGHVPAWKFVVYNFIGAAIWAPLVVGIGYEFGEIVEAALGNMKKFELAVFGAVSLFGVILFLAHLRRMRRHEPPQPPPGHN
jgi:membrane protein DedA with SNARE-associated domain